MTDEELKKYFTDISKRQDKILKLLTMSLKALHLVPTSEKEEREMQIAQRKSYALSQKVNDELDIMENKPSNTSKQLSLLDLFENLTDDVYNDVIANDYLDRKEIS